jgi:hypothetical protein
MNESGTSRHVREKVSAQHRTRLPNIAAGGQIRGSMLSCQKVDGFARTAAQKSDRQPTTAATVVQHNPPSQGHRPARCNQHPNLIERGPRVNLVVPPRRRNSLRVTSSGTSSLFLCSL